MVTGVPMLRQDRQSHAVRVLWFPPFLQFAFQHNATIAYKDGMILVQMFYNSVNPQVIKFDG
jgi:hypothetical protein